MLRCSHEATPSCPRQACERTDGGYSPVRDTFLIDEAFAVGDAAFQNKCHEKMSQFRAEGKTIVFVSHALESVKQLCRRSMLGKEGRIVTIGDSDKVIDHYRAMLGGGVTG